MGCGGACGCQDCYGSDDCKDASKPDVCMAPRGTFATVLPKKPMARRTASRVIAVPEIRAGERHDVVWAEYGGSALGVVVPGGTNPDVLWRLLAEPALNVPQWTEEAPDGESDMEAEEDGALRPGLPPEPQRPFEFPEPEMFGRRGGGGGGGDSPYLCDCTCVGAPQPIPEYEPDLPPSDERDPLVDAQALEKILAHPAVESKRLVWAKDANRPSTVALQTVVNRSVDIEAFLGGDPAFLENPRRLVPEPVEAASRVTFDSGLSVGSLDLVSARPQPQTASIAGVPGPGRPSPPRGLPGFTFGREGRGPRV